MPLPLPVLGLRRASAHPTMGTRDDEYDYLFKGNSRAASSPWQPEGSPSGGGPSAGGGREAASSRRDSTAGGRSAPPQRAPAPPPLHLQPRGKGRGVRTHRRVPAAAPLARRGRGRTPASPASALPVLPRARPKPCSGVSGARWSRVCWASPPAPQRSPQNVRFGLLSVAVIWRVCVSGQDTSGRFPLRERAEATAARWDGEQRSSVRMPGADKDYFPF